MQDSPSKETMLLAIAKFIERDLRPKLEGDARLSFRALIASNLCAVLAQECFFDEEQDTQELARLAKLFSDVDAEAKGSRAKTEIRSANERIARKVREDALSDEERRAITAHVRETLAEKLRINNPRFSLDP